MGENRIAINEGMSEEQTIKTMVHEITHSRLHSTDKQNNSKDTIERNTMEIEAESCAFVVSKHFEIDTDDYTFKYVAVWSQDKELKQLEASLKTIQKEANSLISEIEEKLEAKLNKNKKSEKESNISEILPKEIEKLKILEAPYIEIMFSEIEDKNYFSEGEKIPFKKANERFKEAEKEVREKKSVAKVKNEYYPYLKTKFVLTLNKDTKKVMRYDIGDNSSGDLKEFCGKHLGKEDLKFLNKSSEKSKDEKKEVEIEMEL